jgi:hypothetical protein
MKAKMMTAKMTEATKDEDKRCYYPGCKTESYIRREVYRGDSKVPTHAYYLCEKHSKA